MERTSTASTKTALFLLAALFAFSVYRAAVCDVTPPEAWNYDRYIAPSWQESLRQFDVNNHVLNTLLVRISTSALGRKEIALRLRVTENTVEKQVANGMRMCTEYLYSVVGRENGRSAVDSGAKGERDVE